MQTESYGQVMSGLAETYASAMVARAEADQWYERQLAAARAAVSGAAAAAAEAAEEVAAAQAALQVTDAEAAHLWQQLVARLGAAGARLGGTPPPTAGAAATAEPDHLLVGVRELLVRSRQPRSWPGWAYLVLALYGTLGAGLASGVGWGLRAGGRELGDDFAIALPVLGQIVTLLGPLVGLGPAKLLADRQGAAFDAVAIAVAVAAGLATTCGLGLALR